MKSKILSLFLFAIILSVAMVAAATDVADNVTLSLSNDLTKSADATVLTITNNDATNPIDVNLAAIADISDGDGHTISIADSATGTINIAASGTATVNLSHSLTDTEKEDLALGIHKTTITVENDADNTDTKSISLNFQSGFCEIGEIIDNNPIEDGDRILEIVYVKDRSSEDDWEWKPLDEIDVDVKVKFENDDDEDDDIDAIIEIGLYDTIEDTWIDLNHDEDLEREVSLDEGESKTETFTITVPIEDVEDSNTRYKLYAKVYDDEDGEDNICTDNDGDDYYQDIKIEKESYEIILTEIDYPTPVPCGEEVEITAKIHNTGTHDEDKVIVTMFNSELDLNNVKSEVFELDEGDSDRLSFNFRIPEDAEEKVYSVLLYASYKYSKSSENYREESKDYIVKIKVQGACEAEAAVQITAELDPETPEAIAGEQVIVKATVKNTGEEQTTYIISTVGSSAWASLVDITPKEITLDAGESEDVSIILDLDEESGGDQEFTIKASVDGETVKEQKVALTVNAEEGLGAGITGSAIGTHIKENAFIYAIVIINLILIIAIISVVRRMAGSQIQ